MSAHTDGNIENGSAREHLGGARSVETNKLIDRLHELSKIGIVNYKHDAPALIEAADRIEELDERIAIMQESMETLEKRNEPMPPRISQEILGTYLVCGNCSESLEMIIDADSISAFPWRWQYCRKCGQAVKWEV